MYEAQNIAGWENPKDEFPITLRDLQPVAPVHGAGNQRNTGLAASEQGSSIPLLPVSPSQPGQSTSIIT
jgi:hypothetical protein